MARAFNVYTEWCWVQFLVESWVVKFWQLWAGFSSPTGQSTLINFFVRLFIAFAAHCVEQVDGSTVEDMVEVVYDLVCDGDCCRARKTQIFYTKHFRFYSKTLIIVETYHLIDNSENSAFRYGGTRVRVRQQGKGPYTP